MVGANYTYEINSKTGIYGEAGLGVNIRYITDLKASYYSNFITYKYDPTYTFAYQLGAGVEINNKITVGLNFYNLGGGKVKGKEKTNTGSQSFKLERVTPTLLMVRVGFKL